VHEQYIGKRLSTAEIFETFIGMAVTGKPDSSQYPTIYVAIEFIGTPEEAEERFRRGGCCIHYGCPPRKGEGVIWDSRIKMEDLVGDWNTSVTADGWMSNERMVLKQDGTGIFAEANMGPYYGALITWYVENNVLYINTDDRNICNAKIEYKPNAIVPCMSGKERRFTELSAGAYELTYYRDISHKTLAELEQEACMLYDDILKNCD